MTEIVDDCQTKGGFGEYADIGDNKGWVVRVIEFDGTELGRENGTVVIEGYRSV